MTLFTFANFLPCLLISITLVALAATFGRKFPLVLYGIPAGIFVFFMSFGLSVANGGYQQGGLVISCLSFLVVWMFWPRHMKAPGDKSGGLIFFER